MKLVFDINLMRPGCALLQAAMGGDEGVANRFHAEAWLLAPTPAMKAYEVTPEQYDKIVKFVNGGKK